ncbi:BMC domain-containing protein [bacterium]|nr:BMC domain-containing protein [bacterium]
MKEPCIGLIEFKSVARGVKVTDIIVKKAPVKVLETHPICPGKYVVLFAGEVADVEESMKAGIEAAGDLLINDLMLPRVHEDIIPSLTGTTNVGKIGAIGIVETFSIASCVVAGDIAAKATSAKLVEMRLANGLGGKAYFVMTGELCDIQASIEAASEYVRADGLLAGSEIIENPHPEVIDKLLYW